jgi:hypothetical protein
MNKSALRARNYRLGGQRRSSARLSPAGGRRTPVKVAIPLIQSSVLREQSRRYHDKLLVASKISHSLADADSFAELYERLACSVYYLMPRVQMLYLFRVNTDTGQALCVYASQDDSPQPRAFDPAMRTSPGGSELINGVLRLRRAMVMNDLNPADGAAPTALQSVIAAPMIHLGQVEGVLEAVSLSRQRFGMIEIDLISLIANSAAVAMETLRLRSELKTTSRQLNSAYETAVEAWRRALELRDSATEGHGCRVAEMTVRLALSLGFGSVDLTHLRFGAQLHDIGKIGVPDSVLLKPGPLDEADKKIMRKHPVYAYEMLNSIPNFGPILDIPYSHHERWDGEGYPRGLRGEQIPLPARIFAVIDVWDALRSDRPYRNAWPEQEVFTYIREESGKHFDPQVVDAFLNMMTSQVM